MEIVEYKREGDKVHFTIPKGFDGKNITLIMNNNILHVLPLLRPKTDLNLWITHGFIKQYPDVEIKLLVDYFGSKGNDNIGSDLFYLHTAKCGGTSVEVAGYEYGIKWGTHDKRCPSYYHHDTYSKSINDNPDIFKNKVLFTTVRNPYKRILSFVYCPYRNINGGGAIKDKINFNEVIKRIINTRPDAKPCYDFVYYKDKKVVPHVLRLENLTDEFNQLMFEYNSDIRMENHSNKSSDFGIKKQFGIEDISKKNLMLINQTYFNDFHYFGYEMIT